MKQHLYKLLFALAICASPFFANAYNITVESNCKSGTAYLTYHLGTKVYIEDSTDFNNKGIAVFKKNKQLEGGIYSIFFPGKNLFADFLMDRTQNMTIVADTNDLSKIVIKGSFENELYQQYMTYVNKVGKDLQQAEKSYNNAKSQADKKKYENEYNRLNDELNKYRMDVVEKHPNSMLAAMLNSIRSSPTLDRQVVNAKDTADYIAFYRKHYWDYYNFMDGRLVRTPFFLPKLENYYRTIISPLPADSVIADIDHKLLYARNDSTMFKFLLNWYTDEYYNPKIMGQDAIFVHLFEKYHSKGFSPWLTNKQQDDIANRAYMVMENLIGKPAANLEVLDMNDKLTTLYDVNAKQTVVVFWDPTCSHCKEELPHLDSLYQVSWKAKGIKVFAMLTDPLYVKEWKDYVNAHHLTEWTNVYQSKAMGDKISQAGLPSYKQLFDITSTPTLYLLDADKRIVAKKLTWKQINSFIEQNAKKQNQN